MGLGRVSLANYLFVAGLEHTLSTVVFYTGPGKAFATGLSSIPSAF